MPTRTLLMDNWEFCLKDAPAPGDYAPVRLPHSWNVLDGQDGGGDYYRGKGWYRRVFSFEPAADKRYFVEFLGVNSVADVYLNGTHLGQHRGGYTCFRFELTGALVRGENTLLVCADNSPFPDVIPLEADFTFFGGIYREVYFLETGPTHFSLSDFGSDGVRLSYPNTPEVASAAALCVEARVETAEETGVQLHVRVLSPAPFAPCPGIAHPDFAPPSEAPQTVAEAVFPVRDSRASGVVRVSPVHLWDGRRDPYRYRVVCTLEKEGRAVDEAVKDVGFRYVHIDPKKGFFLNGRAYPLRGVNRHQDRENMGWAITEAEHDEDFALLYEMGANAVRLAHYPHHPHFYDLCDRYGLPVWAEIPFVDHIGGLKRSPLPTDTVKDPAVTARQLENAEQQLTELILQQGHRPSIFCWSMANEVQFYYGKTAAAMLEKLHALAKTLDPTRYSALATNHYLGDKWQSDIKGCNIYPGWYIGSPRHFYTQAAAHVRANRRRGVAVSEYGAGSNTLHHTETPKKPRDTTCEFHPEEWANIVHEHALRYFMSKRAEKLWGTFVWNMFDFAIDSRHEGGQPGRNDKGLVTYDRRTKKDAYFLYQAYWRTLPVTYITSRRFAVRRQETVSVKVYSNASRVSLSVNGAPVGEKSAAQCRQAHVFVFRNVRLRAGENTVEAHGDNGAADTVVWQLER